jgi:hypothetical protein
MILRFSESSASGNFVSALQPGAAPPLTRDQTGLAGCPIVPTSGAISVEREIEHVVQARRRSARAARASEVPRATLIRTESAISSCCLGIEGRYVANPARFLSCVQRGPPPPPPPRGTPPPQPWRVSQHVVGRDARHTRRWVRPGRRDCRPRERSPTAETQPRLRATRIFWPQADRAEHAIRGPALEMPPVGVECPRPAIYFLHRSALFVPQRSRPKGMDGRSTNRCDNGLAGNETPNRRLPMHISEMEQSGTSRSTRGAESAARARQGPRESRGGLHVYAPTWCLLRARARSTAAA